MKQLNYKASTLKIVDILSEISKKDSESPIKFTKDLEGIHVKSRNDSSTIVFTVDAPSENLDIVEQTLCFYNYAEFFKFFSAFQEPNLYHGIADEGTEIEREVIVIEKDRKKVTYPVSDPEVTARSVKKINDWESDATFTLTPENVKSIKNILNLVQGKKVLIKLSFVDTVVKIYIYSNDTNNSYEEILDLESPVSEDFEIVILKDVFKYLINTTYTVHSSKEGGCLRFFFDYEDNKCSVLVTSEDE